MRELGTFCVGVCWTCTETGTTDPACTKRVYPTGALCNFVSWYASELGAPEEEYPAQKGPLDFMHTTQGRTWGSRSTAADPPGCTHWGRGAPGHGRRRLVRGAASRRRHNTDGHRRRRGSTTRRRVGVREATCCRRRRQGRHRRHSERRLRLLHDVHVLHREDALTPAVTALEPVVVYAPNHVHHIPCNVGAHTSNIKRANSSLFSVMFVFQEKENYFFLFFFLFFPEKVKVDRAWLSQVLPITFEWVLFSWKISAG